MLKYRVNVRNIDKTKAVLPVTSVQFTDFSELYDEDNKPVVYNGLNRNKIMVTCECEDTDKLKDGSIINVVNTLYLNYGDYTFNNEFAVTGVNEENRSFSFLIDKYYTLKPFLITKNSNEQVVLRLDGLHYYDNTFYINNGKQEIPIYFRYFKRNGEEEINVVKFEFFSSDTLLTDFSTFDGVLPNMIFGSEAENYSEGNLSGIEIFRETFLFSEYTNYFFEYERAVVNVPIHISNSFDTNLYQSHLLQEHFVNEEKEKAINKIVDLERDVYYPVIKENGKFTDIYTIRFNLHFREHRGNNWLVDENSLWNGVEQEYESDVIKENSATINSQITDDNVSDLLNFLDFNNDDIRYQKNKLKKSFLRLSFYDSTNPANQNMLGYSTIFLDSGNLFSKYVRYFETDGFKSIMPDRDKDGKYTVTDNKKGNSVGREYDFKEDHRLSSQLVVKNKNLSKASSEGFYLYLWKDNESALPQDLYMKVEFNHAGYGRTIPFMMPYWDKIKWEGDEEKKGIKSFQEIINDWNAKKYVYYEKNNESHLITEEEYIELTEVQREKYVLLDIFKWKTEDKENDGHYGMRQYMKFSYIHLKYQYDKTNDKHIYYLDTDTYDNSFKASDGDDGNKEMIINLYEAKVE